MDQPLKIDVAGAEAALEAAGINPLDVAQVRPRDPFDRSPQPTSVEAPSAAVTEPAPDAATTEPPAPTAADDFGQFSNIPDEALGSNEALMQMRRSLQADYTKKQMEAAPWRKLAEEVGVADPEQLKELIATAQQIQDPQNWPKLHGELTEYFEQMGVAPVQAQQQASEQMARFAPTTPDPVAPDMTALGLDPEEADPATLALFNQVQALTQQVQGFTAQQEAQRTQQAEQARWNALASQLTNEETVIRAQNPHYNDENVKTIYKIMGVPSGKPGELTAAQAEYESMRGSILSEYISKKGAAIATTPQAPAGGAVIAAEAPTKLTPDEAHARAMAYVAEADRQDAQ